MLYTFLFGSYAALCRIATGSILPSLAVHMLCNSLGLPVVQGVRGSTMVRVLWTLEFVGFVGFFMGVRILHGYVQWSQAAC